MDELEDDPPMAWGSGFALLDVVAAERLKDNGPGAAEVAPSPLNASKAAVLEDSRKVGSGCS
jgi:hypothetical protein